MYPVFLGLYLEKLAKNKNFTCENFHQQTYIRMYLAALFIMGKAALNSTDEGRIDEVCCPLQGEYFIAHTLTLLKTRKGYSPVHLLSGGCRCGRKGE